MKYLFLWTVLLSGIVQASDIDVDYDRVHVDIETLTDYEGNRYPAKFIYEKDDGEFEVWGNKKYRTSVGECVYQKMEVRNCQFFEETKSGQCETVEFIN